MFRGGRNSHLKVTEAFLVVDLNPQTAGKIYVGGQMSNSVSSPSTALQVPLSKSVSISTGAVVLIAPGSSRCVNI